MGSIEAYTRLKVLGRGSFGCAVLCEQKGTGIKVVIKEIDMAKMPPAERDAALQEARVLASLDHPNIVRCHESFVDTRDSKLYIVMDWAQEGDLYTKIRRLKGKLMSEREVVQTFTQICSALAYVHDRKILHRDIKTQNIFLDEGGVVKLGDFGVAKVLGSTMALASTAVGTPYYLSPEICENRRYNAKSDMWSLGCVLYEMCTTRHAFDAASIGLLINKILRGRYPPISATYSKDLRDLVAKMLSRDATKRPAASGIMGMQIVQRYIPLSANAANANNNAVASAAHPPHPYHHQYGAGGMPNTPQAGIRRGSNVAAAAGNNRGGGGGGQEQAAALAVLAHNNRGFEVRGKSAALTASSSPSGNDDNPAKLRAERDAERRRQEKLAMERKRAEEAEARREEARRKREAREREMKRLEAERRRAEEMEREKERLEKQKKLAKQQARQQARQMQEERLKEFKRCQQQAIKNKQKHLDENDPTKDADNDIEIFLPDKPKRRASQQMNQHQHVGETAAAAQPERQHNENIGIDIVLPKPRGPKPNKANVAKDDDDRVRREFFEAREAAKKNRERVLSDLAGDDYVRRGDMKAGEGASDVDSRVAGIESVVADKATVSKALDTDIDDGMREQQQQQGISAIVIDDGPHDGRTETKTKGTEDEQVQGEDAAEKATTVIDVDARGDECAHALTDDDNDEPSPISKFVLNGRTLELPNVNNESDSVHTRVEALRQFLEKVWYYPNIHFHASKQHWLIILSIATEFWARVNLSDIALFCSAPPISNHTRLSIDFCTTHTHHQELGLDAFLEAYRILDDVDEDVDDDFVVDEMERILGQEKMGFIGLIHQLLISEEFIFHHQ